MKKKHLAILLLVILIAVVAVFILRRPQPIHITQVIPEDAILYISLPHLRSSWDQIVTSDVWGDLDRTEFGPTFRQELDRGKRELESQVGADIDPILEALDEEIGIALFDYNFFPFEPARFLSGCLFLADIGSKGHPLLKRIIESEITGRIEEEIEGVIFEKSKYEGVDINKIVTPRNGTYCYTFLRNLLLVSADASVMKKAIQVYKTGDSHPSIETEMRKVRLTPPEESNLFAYINAKRVRELLLTFQRGDDREAIETLLSSLGLKSIRSCGIDVSVTEVGLTSQIAFSKDAPSAGAIQLLEQKPRVFKMVQLVPSKATGFATMSLDDPGDFWEKTLSMSRNIFGLRGYEEFLRGIKNFEDESSLNVEDDIVKNLKNEIGCIFFDLESQLVLVAEMKSTKRAEESLGRLKKVIQEEGLNVETESYQGHQITFARTGLDEVPCCALVKDFLLLSVNPDLIKSVIDSRKGSGTLSQEDTFNKTLQQMPDKNTMMTYLNLSRLPDWDTPLGETLGTMSLTGTEEALRLNLTISSFDIKPKKSLFQR